MLPRSGDVLIIDKRASVQFGSPLLFRVIRIENKSTYDGWVWLDGYELNTVGDAVERRSLFVQIDGLRLAGRAPDRRTPPPRNQPPAGPGESTGDVVRRRATGTSPTAASRPRSAIGNQRR